VNPTISAAPWLLRAVVAILLSAWSALADLVPAADPAPTPGEIVATAAGRVREIGGQLSEDEMRHILALAGWPEELTDEALRVAWVESRWSPYARGYECPSCLGLFQLHADTWGPYCGVDREALFDPLANATCALSVYLYDLERGQPAWWQWPWTH